MELKCCNTCGWFRHWAHVTGNCANPRNGVVKWIGGGEYSSSEQCIVAPKVDVNSVCGWHEAFGPQAPVKGVEIVMLPRTPDMKPYEPTKWELRPSPSSNGGE